MKSTLTKDSDVRELFRNRNRKTLFLAVVRDGTQAVNPDLCEDIIRIRWRPPDSWLPRAGSGFLAACEYNNFQEGIPLTGEPDFIQEILDYYAEEEKRAIVFDDSIQDELESSFDRTLREFSQIE